MKYRTHPAEPDRDAHLLLVTLPNGVVMTVCVDTRDRLLVEVSGGHGVAVVPVTSGSVAILPT